MTVAAPPKPSALERVFRPQEGTLTAEHARYILTLGFTEAETQRYLDLSERVQLGALSPAERAELHDLVTANDVLSMLQLKARATLARLGREAK